MNTKEFFTVWKGVFSRKRYIAYALLVMFVFYTLNVVIVDYKNIVAVYGSRGFFDFLSTIPFFYIGLKNLTLLSSFITLLLIMVLVGILFSLIFFRAGMIKNTFRKTGLLSSFGIFLGVLAPGCAACGLGLLPLLGFGSVILASFPLEGLEFSILAVAVLSFSVFKITKDLHKGFFCEIPEPGKLEKKK